MSLGLPIGKMTKTKLTALDVLAANVMIADAKLNIVYLNPTLSAFLHEAEAELKQDLPNFSMASLIGSNIDIFHKVPSHQRSMLAKLTQPHRATIKVGTRMFDLLVTPLMEGARGTGFVVEWSDAAARLLNVDYAAQIRAIGRSQASIAFGLDGTILEANENFLATMGYSLAEIRGGNHSLFIDPVTRTTQDYADFWDALRRGKAQTGQFRRFAKDGAEVFLQASYNPILDEKGRVTKVVKFCTDVTPRVRAVDEIGAALTRLARGDLEQRITQAFGSDLDKLRTDLNSALDTLQATVRKVGASSAAIQTGTEAIRASSNELSCRTEQQAASLEETAAALDQITATVRKTATAAAGARKVVGDAKTDAEQSGAVVRQAKEAMNAIEDSSSQMSRIIGVIDEIAFQTNLLALNAGVEAARAGEAGRGFAVVASEVRALAQRSADAAKEIKGLISVSTDRVSQGVSLVSQADQSLNRIVGQVNQINGIVADIASSAQEQSVGIEQVNVAVNTMDQMTQQNASMAQQSMESTLDLAQETTNLTQLVGQFRVGAMETSQPAHAARATPLPALRRERVAAFS